MGKKRQKYNKKFRVGVCHPGSIPSDTGLLKNANNSSACPESPNINCTNAKIIQTTNQIKINII